MTGFPFQTERIARNRVEHQLPCLGAEADIGRSAIPAAAAVFDCQLNAVCLGAAGKLAEHPLEFGNGIGYAFVRVAAGEHSDHVAAIKPGIVYQQLDAAADSFVLQSIAVMTEHRYFPPLSRIEHPP